MANTSILSPEELKEEVIGVLRTANLNIMTARNVRELIENKYNCCLLSRKKEISKIIFDSMKTKHGEAPKASDKGIIGNQKSKESAVRKRPQRPQRKAVTDQKNKRKSLYTGTSSSGTEPDDSSDSDYAMPRKRRSHFKDDYESDGSGDGKPTDFMLPSPQISG